MFNYDELQKSTLKLALAVEMQRFEDETAENMQEGVDGLYGFTPEEKRAYLEQMRKRFNAGLERVKI